MGLALSCAAPAYADVFTVTSVGDPGVSGVSLRSAIHQANLAPPGSVITFDPSLNGSTITLTLGQLAIGVPMSIVGPGAGKLTISGANSSRLFYVQSGSPDAPVTISGLTLLDGYANDSGGAIYALNSTLQLQDSVVSGSHASGTGAISLVTTGTNGYYDKLTNVSIQGNSSASGSGIVGVVFGAGATGSMKLRIAGCTISNNTGRAIFANGSTTLHIYGSTFSSNTGSEDGGAISAFRLNHLDVFSSAFLNNSAARHGGALYLYDTPTAIYSSVISGNSAVTGNGGGLMMTGDPGLPAPLGYLNLTTSTVSNNNAYDFGGGIDVERAYELSILYSLISGNGLSDFTTGANGGGLAVHEIYDTARVMQSTVYHNFAYHAAGGIGIFQNPGGFAFQLISVTVAKNSTVNGYSNGVLAAVGQPSILNSIIANNSNEYGQTEDLVGSFNVHYSLIKNVTTATISGSNNITNGTDPQLGPLTVNGGPTLTMLPAAASPVVNGGSFSESGFGFDQRGVPRIVGSDLDMGAVERQSPEVMIFRTGFDPP